MADISWIKLKTQMFDDEKIQLIEAMPEADAILVIWIKLLIQAGKTNSNGFILLSENIPLSPEMLATIFRRPLQIIKFALKTLKELGMIEVTDSNVICISNWEKHQNVEGLDRIREQNRLRQQRYREAKRLNSAQKQTNSNVTVTSRNGADIDKEKNKNKINISFDTFWNLYDKKVDRKACEKKWNKLSNEQRSAIIKHLPDYIKSTPDKKFRKNPATYLNNNSWENEIIISAAPNNPEPEWMR